MYKSQRIDQANRYEFNTKRTIIKLIEYQLITVRIVIIHDFVTLLNDLPADVWIQFFVQQE